jgi:hypothetical protein
VAKEESEVGSQSEGSETESSAAFMVGGGRASEEVARGCGDRTAMTREWIFGDAT